MVRDLAPPLPPPSPHEREFVVHVWHVLLFCTVGRLYFYCYLNYQRFHFCFETVHSLLLSRSREAKGIRVDSMVRACPHAPVKIQSAGRVGGEVCVGGEGGREGGREFARAIRP